MAGGRESQPIGRGVHRVGKGARGHEGGPHVWPHLSEPRTPSDGVAPAKKVPVGRETGLEGCRTAGPWSRPRPAEGSSQLWARVPGAGRAPTATSN